MTDQDPQPPTSQSPRAGRLSQAEQLTEATAQRLISLVEASEPVKRIRGSQLATALLGTIGFALFIFGVERAAEDIPVVSNPYGSIAAGIILLAITGLLLRRLTGGAE